MNRQEAIALGLKEGSKLYALSYYAGVGRGNGREWATYTVKKLNPKNVSLRGGYAWGIPYSEIGEDKFLTKEELIKDAIKNHEIELSEKIEEEIKPLEKEIEYLKRKLSEASNE